MTGSDAGAFESALPDPREVQIAQLEQRLDEQKRLIDLLQSNSGECRLVWDPKPDKAYLQAVEILPMLSEEPALTFGDSENPHLLIEGDNYYALLELSYTHRGKFDVIYIDPPYATNSKSIGYDDFFDHSSWLSLMEPRLRLARHLLAPDGFLAVSIDDNEMPRLVLLLEQIFGEGATKVVAVKMSPPGGMKMTHANNAGTIPKIKEYVVFAKTGGVSGLLIERIPRKKWDLARYNRYMRGLTQDTRAELADLVGQTNPSEADLTRVESIFRGIDFVNVTEAAREAGINTKNHLAFESWLYDNSWRICALNDSAPALLSRRDQRALESDAPFLAVRSAKKGGLYMMRRENRLARVIFSDLFLTMHPCDLWVDIGVGRNLAEEGGVTFRNGKKPLQLVRRIIKAHPNPNALVLDFFAGSGTTGEAVLEINAREGGSRRFVLVTNNEAETDDLGKLTGRYICHDITYPRLTGKFVIGEPEHYRAVGKDEARQAAVEGAPKLKVGGALGRYGGCLRYFVADSSHHAVSREEARVRDRAALRVADLAKDTLRIVSDCYRPIETGTDSFEMFESDARVLAILHRYAAREQLVEALRNVAGERNIDIYPSLPGGQVDENWFIERLGKLVIVKPLPDPIIRNYNNLVREARR